ncbi:BA14K family protein [Rhizobium sp. T1470]|uniref:BA14K family protein n=1 Tax=unclassified Rhizobium TaxID=2613769 RepID=UPI001AAEF9EA|nr:BA14K family protein [Rhizobium sp. T1473]MCA0801282.1 BA14K family protein [Rhizobium sp. T1473]
MKRLAIVTLSLVTALTSVPPAIAFPTVAVPKIEVSEAQPVQYRHYRGGYNRGYGGGYRGYGHHNGGDGWAWALGGLATGAIIGGLLAQPSYYGPSYYDQGYYGPTYYRQHYYAPPRYYRQVYSGGNAHTRWCYARYRSYRAYDNTFQPFYGSRRACASPYY